MHCGGPYLPPKLPLPGRRSPNPGTCLNPGPVRATMPNHIRIACVVFPQYTGQTDRQTDAQTDLRTSMGSVYNYNASLLSRRSINNERHGQIHGQMLPCCSRLFLANANLTNCLPRLYILHSSRAVSTSTTSRSLTEMQTK